MTIFDYIIENKLPMHLNRQGDDIIINCHAWDIQEIDDFMQLFKGTRQGFYIRMALDEAINDR